MNRALTVVLVASVALAACGEAAETDTVDPGQTTATTAVEDGESVPASSFPLEMTISFPLEATIPELQEAMEAGSITSAELVDFSLARIAAYDSAGPELNALITVNPRAREDAEALDAERAASGPRVPSTGSRSWSRTT